MTFKCYRTRPLEKIVLYFLFFKFLAKMPLFLGQDSRSSPNSKIKNVQIFPPEQCIVYLEFREVIINP
jgi:hypothetical protein